MDGEGQRRFQGAFGDLSSLTFRSLKKSVKNDLKKIVNLFWKFFKNLKAVINFRTKFF